MTSDPIPISSTRETIARENPSLREKLKVFAGDIKIAHSVFALPWALLSAALAGKQFPGSLTIGKIALILLCMITARTIAMAANRLLDARLDAQNPRTARRAIPAGKLSRGFMLGIIGVCIAAFVAGCAAFEFLYHNPWPLILCIPVLAFLCGYPLLKRFSRLCHYYLGTALALAPVCAWIAITGRIDWPPLIMFASVLTWTAGFDIIYACQDYQSDLQLGVFSVPAKVGIPRALWIGRFTHAICIAMLILLGQIVPQFRALYSIGVALAILLLIIEHAIVKPDDLSKVNLAFFTMNGIISVAIGTLGILDVIR
jgi:4-hydroxybenzoate polyprenyltransferase